ncbi:MAG: cysteine synthase A [Proteobacteria bacterium]|nr:cysteine synthase A [Pseudomonadota bacterium]MCH8189445.1 cysteine synthase A [Pseudomonadota bacterium]
MDPRPEAQKWCRGQIYDSVVDTIGATPLVRLRALCAEANCKADVVGKLEYFNPLASVKDRIGRAMIEAAEREGRIRDGTVLVEPTSGNTGLALAFICAAKGYRLILTIPDNTTAGRRKMLELLGAEIRLTPASQGMRGAILKAHEIVEDLPDALLLQQFENPANPEAHRTTTGEEIWTDTAGEVDVLVAGVGTGGTLTGVAELLRERKPEVMIVAVEPEDSAVLTGGPAGTHAIEGIGAGFKPAILKAELIDEIVTIANETARTTSRRAARLQGLAVGISSGAAIAAALEVGSRPGMEGKLIVAVLPDFAERYLSTPLFDDL